jgi:hypothetical protein
MLLFSPNIFVLSISLDEFEKLAYADDVNLIGDDIRTIKTQTYN